MRIKSIWNRHVYSVFALSFCISISIAPGEVEANQCSKIHSVSNRDMAIQQLAELRLDIDLRLASGEDSIILKRLIREFNIRISEINKSEPELKIDELIRTHIEKMQSNKRILTDVKEERNSRMSEGLNEINKLDPLFLGTHMVFHKIEPGKFQMYGQEGEVSKPFEIMATPVTQIVWSTLKIIMGERDYKKINPSEFKEGDGSMIRNIVGIDVPMKPAHPVENVNWFDVEAFVNKLNQLSNSAENKIQKELKYVIAGHNQGDIYRLPTEAEWKFVASGRGEYSKYTYYFGNRESELNEHAWYGQFGESQTHPVAQKKPLVINGKEFYDLLGNVEEWILDGGSGDNKIILGGSWSSSSDLGIYKTFYIDGKKKNGAFGFRLVRTRP